MLGGGWVWGGVCVCGEVGVVRCVWGAGCRCGEGWGGGCRCGEVGVDVGRGVRWVL